MKKIELFFVFAVRTISAPPSCGWAAKDALVRAAAVLMLLIWAVRASTIWTGTAENTVLFIVVMFVLLVWADGARAIRRRATKFTFSCHL